jgi:long-chain acyl-CoA synthetase
MRTSLNSYLEDFLRRGGATAFGGRRGLRVERRSYKQVAETAYRFARELEARGIGKGERVVFWAANSAGWVAAFFGCLLRGAIVVPLDVESAPDFAARVSAQTKPRLILLSAATKERGQGLGVASLALEDLDEAVAGRSPEAFEPRDVNAGDLAEIIYTSGTTSEPRGVCLTHKNLLANIAPLEDEIQKYLRWERLVHPVRFLNLLPLSHVFGQFMGLFVPQLLGGEVYFQDSLNPSEIARAVKSQRISVVVTVPRMLESLREHVERREAADGRGEELKRRLSAAEGAHPLKRFWMFRRIHRYFGWKFWAFVTGGATLDEASETFWRRLGFAVVQGYGMTETASLVSVNHPFKSGRGSVGKAMPGQELKLGEGGEILVRGANVSPGYWQDGAARPIDEEGWLPTGDIGELDAEGNIYFRGRKKETIVTAAGLNVHPEDIEAALNRQPEIKLSAVIGVRGARGPEPLAVLIMRDPQADPALAVARANDTLARHQRVRLWRVWPEADFPRTPTQKVRKRDIVEKLGIGVKGQGTGDESRRPDELSTAAAVASVSSPASALSGLNLSNPQSLSPNPLSSLDSLGRVELLSALEDRYQIEIDEASFTAATTAADIERIIQTGGGAEQPAPQYPYPDWTQRFPATWLRLAIFYLVILPITSLLCWTRVRGLKNLKSLRGPALFICNHITYFDHALVLAALPGRFRRRMAIAMEGERLRWWRRPPAATPWPTRLRWLVQYFLTVLIFNTFSLPKSSGFRRSFAYAGESVDRGFSVLVFPEGARIERVGINHFKSGIGILAAELGVPVVPARIDGLAELKVSGRRGFAGPGTVTVNFGEPVTYSPDEDPATITADLERRVKEMMNAE